MSRFFIDRPNFAWVVAIFIALAGILSIPSIGVEKYPQVAPPQIEVQGMYPGATAQTINDSVVALIEEELNGAKGMLYYESSSASNGTFTITATFKSGTDPDFAQVDVQNRLGKAEPRLPASVRNIGVSVDQRTAGFLVVYLLRAKEGSGVDPQSIADYAARVVNPAIRRLEGVGSVTAFSSESAMRVWVDTEKLRSFDLTIAQVSAAIAAQNIQVSAGSFGAWPNASSQELTANLKVKGLMESPAEFGEIILSSTPEGGTIRLRDVARVEIGAETYNFFSEINGQASAGAAVSLAPGANALATATLVQDTLTELSAAFPSGVEYVVPVDTSKFVEVAVEEVIKTLLEAIILVFLVMYLFLQNFRYTIIPTIVVPICLLGTLAVMVAVGFTANMMSLFAMVLAIGILVDDAIVVVENVERIMSETGMHPREATIEAMKEISGAVVGITLALTAVFVPLALMSGSVGIIYRQFSVTVAVSIIISGFLALTLTPALCATMLKPIPKGHHLEKRGFFGWFNRVFTTASWSYGRSVGTLIRKTGWMMLVYLIMMGFLGYSFMKLPTSFVPSEDEGSMIVNVQLPAGATFSRSKAVFEKLNQVTHHIPGVKQVVSVLGFSFSGVGPNAGIGFVTFKPWDERVGPGEDAQSIILKTNMGMMDNTDGQVFAVNRPPIDGMGNTAGFSFRLQDRAGLGMDKLNQALGMVLMKANQSPITMMVYKDGLPDAPELNLEVDRTKAEAMGVAFASISAALGNAFGYANVSDFVNKGRVQRVVVQADAKNRRRPGDLSGLFVMNNRGEQVPLSAMVTPRWNQAPVQLVRYNGFPAYRISGITAPGFASGDGMALMEEIAAELPEGIGYEWTGLSYQENASAGQTPMLIGLAMLAVFLVLVALYESWAIPFSVIMVVPIGAIGAVLATTFMGMTNDVYFKVGLITVAGLAAKNAILIAEFARAEYLGGRHLVESAKLAARLRFRPILMTSMAFILGVLPLALASGAGSASQRAIGIGVVGGMVAATFVGVLYAPLLFTAVLALVKRVPVRHYEGEEEEEVKA